MTINPPTPPRDDAPETIWAAPSSLKLWHVGFCTDQKPDDGTPVVEYRRATTAPDAEKVGVKPLAWSRKNQTQELRAAGLGVIDYVISWGWENGKYHITGDGIDLWFDHREDAKAAAQSDYERRILAALTPAAPTDNTALMEAIRWAHDTLWELNPSNYDHDEVCRLNDASVEAILALAPLLGETHGKSPEWWVERAALASREATPAAQPTEARRCAECDCKNGGSECTWIVTPHATPAPDAGRVKFPAGQTPLNDKLGHRLLDVFNEGMKARDAGTGSPYHGHSLEHCLHASGWVQRDLRLALDAARAAPPAAQDDTALVEILLEARSSLSAYTGGPNGACSETIKRIDAALSRPAPQAVTVEQWERIASDLEMGRVGIDETAERIRALGGRT